MADEKPQKEKTPYKRYDDGTLNCDGLEGLDKTKCIALKGKEQTVKDTKKAMGMPEKKKEEPKKEEEQGGE